ncbi:ATP-binding protein [Paraglaciecola aquimarina]|uniref:histidine kinase n=1 Tax=Paraglaciecola aquimarina TaxID=1235557 RepID=A0ABU3ST78_9ALTE|nr:ATP-binding protein [Paraglaciecola aquimarina]MDU0353218.1 ATP-binding protein [Paraglaciecola aquimarina]
MILARAMRRNNQLSAARALSAAIIKGSKNSIISTKPDGTIISWNHAAEVMFKYSESYALGQSIAKLALLDDIDILTCIQSVSVDNPLHEVDSVLESSHSKTYLSLSLSAIVGANNRFMGVAIIVRDQTIERQAEEKVKQINSELELKVASRTAELEKASKVKNAFISNISHEMRTPLNGIMGTLSLLRKDPLTENQLRYLEMTAVSVNSLAVLINDILDLSKIEAGKLDLDFKAFNPIELVESLTCSLAVKAQEKGLEVILDIADLRCQSITSDPHRFSQILTNLISNGIKFTDTGHIKVTAYCQPLDLNITRFTCSVADTGIGIAEANQSKLFHAFTQEDTEIASKYGGTGLGLSICRQLTHLLNGEISFESTKGIGSTFEFHIDLPTENCVLSSTPKLLENKRCLIVVPYSALEISATKLLKNYGASCLAKQEYIDWLDGNTAMPSQFPDYIFIDFTSPYLSLLDKHWQLITSFTPKVFVLRNSGQPIPLLEHLAVSSLNKPIQLSELTNKLCDRKEQKDALLPVFTKVADDSSYIDDKRKLAGANILIVDDNEINIEVASGMLAELPMNIFRAMNGQQALDVLQAKTKEGVQIHCILMDCQMPILDGYKTSEQIRSGIAGEENSHLPIIAMTANAMLGERKKCINAGMSDYITKPISLDLLVTVVIKWTLSVYQAGPVKEAMVETLTKPMIEKGDVVMWDKESALMRLMQNVKLFKQICRIFANKSPDQMRLLGSTLISKILTILVNKAIH